MGKNILVLEGSPRMDGNSDMLAEAFAEGAGGQGHEVSIIKVSCYRVQPDRQRSTRKYVLLHNRI